MIKFIDSMSCTQKTLNQQVQCPDHQMEKEASEFGYYSDDAIRLDEGIHRFEEVQPI